MVTADDEDSIDHTARSMANEAIQLIKSHDRLCEERWKDNGRRWEEAARLLAGIDTRGAKQLDEIKKQLDKIESSYSARFWTLSLGVIGVLLSICAFLVVKVIFHG